MEGGGGGGQKKAHNVRKPSPFDGERENLTSDSHFVHPFSVNMAMEKSAPVE